MKRGLKEMFVCQESKFNRSVATIAPMKSGLKGKILNPLLSLVEFCSNHCRDEKRTESKMKSARSLVPST